MKNVYRYFGFTRTQVLLRVLGLECTNGNAVLRVLGF